MAKHYMLLIAALFIAAFSLSSCLNSNDDYYVPFTEEEQKDYQTMMYGTYNGVARFYYAKSEAYSVVPVKYDSVKHASWYVGNDSILTLKNFPICKLDSAIQVRESDISTEANNARMVREAISKIVKTVDLKSVYFVPNQQNFVTSDGIHALVYPLYIKEEVVYNNEKHDIYFVFGGGDTQSYWRKMSMTFEYQMLLGGIAIDRFDPKTLSGNYISSTYFRMVRIDCFTK